MPLLDTVTLWSAITVGLVVAGLQNLKWLRVAQRVHYLPREVARVERLWFGRRPLGALWWGGAAAVAILSVQGPGWWGLAWLGFGAALAPLMILPTPWKLSFTGTTGPLAWTPRARRTYVGILFVHIIIGGLAVVVLGPPGVLLPLLFSANLADAALGGLWHVEKRLTLKFVKQAQKKLSKVKPTVVAITGSYGKTSTKGYVAQLVSASHQVVASPASFNNLMGLSKTINEHVVPGTGVFVAEMGMNAEGRIRELATWFPPDIAAITIIGEAHMERLGSQEAIFRAKAEITERAGTVVLPIDQPELRALAEKCERAGKRVIRVSAQGKEADVVLDVERGTLRYGPTVEPVPLDIPPFGHGVNIAVALGIAWALDVPGEQVTPRLADLPVAAHRAEVAEGADGVLIIDDTYNSNPLGAQNAVRSAAAAAMNRKGPFITVTPGMVELGPVQFERNRELAHSVVAAGGRLMIVGRTNKRALREGAGFTAQLFATRADAVTAALRAAGDRGVILYENDLPDHYP
jgi:UDP-N-acetylmuramoyl-tripeptide--D-alanyl-D-alanine ligase